MEPTYVGGRGKGSLRVSWDNPFQKKKSWFGGGKKKLSALFTGKDGYVPDYSEKKKPLGAEGGTLSNNFGNIDHSMGEGKKVGFRYAD